jgi:hypothetical protein
MALELGKIVIYKLTKEDADQVNRRRITREEIQKQIFLGHWQLGSQAHVGEGVLAGEELPMIVTKVVQTAGVDGPGSTALSGQVFLNGNDTLYVTGRFEGDAHGTWSFFPRS